MPSSEKRGSTSHDAKPWFDFLVALLRTIAAIIRIFWDDDPR